MDETVVFIVAFVIVFIGLFIFFLGSTNMLELEFLNTSNSSNNIEALPLKITSMGGKRRKRLFKYSVR